MVRGSSPGGGRDFPHTSRPAPRSTQSLYNGYRVFPGGKAAGAWRWPPTPSSAEFKERVELKSYVRLFMNYLLTPWSSILLEKLTGSQLVKKFPSYYATRRFITAFTNAHHLLLFWASSMHSIPPHTTSWRSILILSYHLRLCLPSGLVPSDYI